MIVIIKEIIILLCVLYLYLGLRHYCSNEETLKDAFVNRIIYITWLLPVIYIILLVISLYVVYNYIIH